MLNVCNINREIDNLSTQRQTIILKNSGKEFFRKSTERNDSKKMISLREQSLTNKNIKHSKRNAFKKLKLALLIRYNKKMNNQSYKMLIKERKASGF